MDEQLVASILSALNEIGSTDFILGLETPISSSEIFPTTIQPSSVMGTLYEAYIFTRIVNAVGQMNAALSVRHGDDTCQDVIYFRMNPGLISSPDPNNTYVHIYFDELRQFELHSSLRVAGKSKIRHDLDVTILERAEAVRCRENANILFRQSKVKLFAECKCYSDNLPLKFGREFLGLSADFSAKSKRFLISSAPNSGSAVRLVRHHNLHAIFDILPSSPQEAASFQDWTKVELDQVLRN